MMWATWINVSLLDCSLDAIEIMKYVAGRRRQAKVGPRGKVGHPHHSKSGECYGKIMMLVSNPSREGTMECVACELQHKIMR